MGNTLSDIPTRLYMSVQVQLLHMKSLSWKGACGLSINHLHLLRHTNIFRYKKKTGTTQKRGKVQFGTFMCIIYNAIFWWWWWGGVMIEICCLTFSLPFGFIVNWPQPVSGASVRGAGAHAGNWQCASRDQVPDHPAGAETRSSTFRIEAVPVFKQLSNTAPGPGQAAEGQTQGRHVATASRWSVVFTKEPFQRARVWDRPPAPGLPGLVIYIPRKSFLLDTSSSTYGSSGFKFKNFTIKVTRSQRICIERF